MTGSMTTGALSGLAKAYRSAPTNRARYLCLASAYSRGGRQGVEALARLIGIDPAEALVSVESWFAARRRARRNQKNNPILYPPPLPPGQLDPAEVRAMAWEAAGWSGVDVGSGKAGRGGGVQDVGRRQAWDAKRGGGK